MKKYSSRVNGPADGGALAITVARDDLTDWDISEQKPEVK